MNSARIRQELVALREHVDRRVDELLEELTQDEVPANDSDWRKPSVLAREVNLSAKTISRYIEEARPKTKGEEHPFAIGKGRRVRVHRGKFDAWRASR